MIQVVSNRLHGRVRLLSAADPYTPTGKYIYRADLNGAISVWLSFIETTPSTSSGGN
jgi:hypothetical protein